LKSLLHERFMYLYYTMIVMSLTTLLDKKSPLFSELCLQSVRMKHYCVSFFFNLSTSVIDVDFYRLRC